MTTNQVEFTNTQQAATSELVSDIERYQKLKAERDAIQKEMDDIVRWVDENVTKTAIWDTPDGLQKVTVVRGVTRDVDLKMLQHVAPDIYKSIVVDKPTLDRAKFNEAREKWGLFAPGTPETKALRETPKKPSLSIGKYVPGMEAPDGD